MDFFKDFKKEKPTIKARVRNFTMYLVRDEKTTEIFEPGEVVFLTTDQAKHYQHLIDIIN